MTSIPGKSSTSLAEAAPIYRLGTPQENAGIPSNLVLEIILVTLRRHFKWAIPSAIAMAMLGVGYLWWSSEPHYRASHWVEVSQHRVLSLGATARPRNLVSGEIPIILSEIIVDPVLARPEIQSLPNFKDAAGRARYLREKLELNGGGTSGRLSITFNDTDPASASIVCNAVADEYMAYRREYEQKQADMNLSLIHI